MPDNSLLLSVTEAAKLLHVGRTLAYELIARGELPYVRLGRTIRVPRAGLETWIAQATLGGGTGSLVASAPDGFSPFTAGIAGRTQSQS